jgi:hypothetical protein
MCNTPGCGKPIRSRGLCSACYNAAYHGRTGPPDFLSVECWCRSNIVLVSQPDVMRGRTRTCGLARCNEGAAVLD